MNQIRKIGLTVLVAVASSVITIAAFQAVNHHSNSNSIQSNMAAKFAAFNPSNFEGVGPVDFRYAAAITTPTVVHIELLMRLRIIPGIIIHSKIFLETISFSECLSRKANLRKQAVLE